MAPSNITTADLKIDVGGLTTCFYTCNTRNTVDKMNSCEEMYRGGKIKDASDIDLIQEYVYLLKNALMIKQEYEYDIIKDKKNLDKYRELLDSYEDPLEKVFNQELVNWLGNTPLMDALCEELTDRGYEDYLQALNIRYLPE